MKTTKEQSSPDDVGWMTNAGTDDCKRHAATAPLWALIEAYKISKARENNKTRSKIIAGAMKRRYGVIAAADMKGGTKP